MVKKTIFSVNTVVPGDELQEINYSSDHTLLDADIILFTPTLLDEWFGSRSYQGKKRLSQNGTFKAVEQTYHWRNEIGEALNAGKLVVVYLNKPLESFCDNGTSRFEKINSYEALAHITSYVTKKGSKIKITNAGKIIEPYWSEFSRYTSYSSVVEGEFSDVLLHSEQGSRVVGAIIRSQAGGAILFLPPVDFYIKEFVESSYSFKWSEAGLQAGKRLVAALTVLAETISANQNRTPPPNWTSADQYRLTKEGHLETSIIEVSNELTRLEETKNTLQQDLVSAGWPRQLLYENGTPLENAIIQSLKLMGFKADSFDDGKSEFDAVFSSPEGRFIGEAEGRDNKAINIDKFSQLMRNLHEDFDREEVLEIAKGVLFGNGYRLNTPEERGELFTEKCLTEANRIGIVLIRTTDMFEPTRYLVEHPDDQSYAKACRKAIADTAGGIVKFPDPTIGPPVDEKKQCIESMETGG